MLFAIYQTGELWFESFSGHNFFSFLEKSEQKTSYISYAVEDVFVNLGDGKIIKASKNENVNSAHFLLESAVNEISKQNLSSYTENTVWSEVLKSRALIFDCGCTLKSKNISSLLSLRTENTAVSVDTDRVIMLPSEGGVKIMFVNKKEKSACSYDVKEASLSDRCLSEIRNISAKETGFTYLSTALNSFTMFDEALFIPIWNDEMRFKQVEGFSVHEDFSYVESNADIFFSNGNNKSIVGISDGYIFSDEDVVVKCASGIFEYSNYKANSNESNDFYDNFLASAKILRNDRYIRNDTYLYDIREDADGSYTFYFNYKLNGLPVVPSSELCIKNDIKSFIEVKTLNGNVTKYKKYAYAYRERESNEKPALTDYISAAEKLYNDTSVEKIDDIRLSYNAHRDRFFPAWSINTNNRTFFVSVTEK